MTRDPRLGRRTWLIMGLVMGLGAAAWWLYAPRLKPLGVPVVAPPTDAPAMPTTLLFTDVTAPAGITFTHDAAAQGKRWYPETIGSGVAFFDYDGDERPDLLFANSATWPRSMPAGASPTVAGLRLYRNRGNGTFEEVTERAGLAMPLYGMGVAAADYDNDGDRDILVTGYLRHLFFINQGDGTFTEATGKVGIRGGTWGVGAAFFDYDRDGWLDLVLSSYVEWRPELEQGLDCSYGTPHKDYCPVRYFEGQGLALYHNEGDGTFRDVTQRAGVASPGTRAFAPAILDYDEDGWPDMFVASDGTPSLLLRNRADGTFENVSVRTGVVLDAGGAAYAGMGIDVAYPHNDNQLCIAIGNFVGEPTTLHCRMPQGNAFAPELYAEMSARMGVGRETLRSVTFGLFFFDADLDGFQDLFMVNGHVVDEAHLRHVPRAQAPQLFRNLGTGRFADVSAQAGLNRALIGRGAAHADYDGDGDLDLVLSQNQGPAVLLRNDAPRRAHFLRIRLTGMRSNRDAIGADVRVYMAETRLRQTVRTGVSYLSQSDAPLIFGLGEARRATRVEVVWPSGIVDRLDEVAADTTLHIVEGQHRVDASQLQARRVDDPATPNQDHYLSHVRDGVAAYRAEDYAQAAAAFEAALPLRPDEPVPYRYLADLYWRREERDKAVQILRQLAQVMPDAYFLDRQGSGYEEGGLPGLAQHIYAEAVRLDPQFPSARFNLGRMYLNQGDTERGIAEVKAALDLHPTFAEAHETLGLAYTETGDWQTAITHLKRALELDPELAVGRNHLGRLYMARGQIHEAIATFQQLVAQHPNASEARHNLAVAYARGGNHEQALAAFRKAIQLQPDLYAARLDLAALALEIQRPQDAIDALVPMLESPAFGHQEQAPFDIVEVHYRLGLAYLMAHRLAEATQELERVIHIQPDHAAAHLYLGSLYYRQGAFDRAWHHARQAERLGAAAAELLAALHRAAPIKK